MTADSVLKTPTIDGHLVETMTGPISTAELGFTLMHEHIIVQSEGMANNFPGVWDRKAVLEKALEMLTTLKAEGVDTIVDLTVLGLGRNVPLLLPIVRQAGIQVITATGLYTFNDLPTF